MAALSVLFLGVRQGWPRYLKFKESRAGNRAVVFFAKHDLANASLSAREALRLNPLNVQSCRVMGDLADLSGSPAALDWLERVVQLQPTPPNKLRFVACALKFERAPFTLARRNLAELERACSKLPAFHVMSAELNLKEGNLPGAAAHFQEASRLEPTNRLHRLNLSAVTLLSTNESAVHAARTELELLSNDTRFAVPARRWLIADELRHNRIAGAHILVHRLVALPQPAFDDQLQHLEILRLSVGQTNASEKSALEARSGPSGSSESDPCDGFSQTLSALQQNASTNLVALMSLSEWMGQHELIRPALRWLATLPAERSRQAPVALARAQLLCAGSDWPTLQESLPLENWFELDFLRLAYLARSAFAQGEVALGETRWGAAIRVASGRLSALNALLALSVEWRSGGPAVLWEIFRRFPQQTWAGVELQRFYAEQGDTWNLNRFYAFEMTRSADLTNRNNFAITSMLLKINTAEARRVARQLYAEQPSSAEIASTYAYCLHLNGHTDEAVRILESFSPQALQAPSVALYYGVLLAANGASSQARPYLALGRDAWLLPEEKALLTQASAALGSRPAE